MTELYFLFLPRSYENRSKWNSSDKINAESFRGRVVFVPSLGHLALQLVRANVDI